MRRESGTVIWFSKSYGFIRPESKGRDVFAHQSEIRTDGFRSLMVGERVTFERDEDDQGRPLARAIEKRY